VSLPKLIEELFSALYESRTGIFGEKAKAHARYKAILERATREFNCDRATLLKVVGPRYHRWIRKNKLPQPLNRGSRIDVSN
jgi:hypothetical protein